MSTKNNDLKTATITEDTTDRYAENPGERDTPRPAPIAALLATSYARLEDAISEAVAHIVKAVEHDDGMEDVIAVLADPWRPLRGSDLDHAVLQRSVGADLRWVALRPRGAEWADDLAFMSEFAERVGCVAAVLAWIDRDPPGPRALVIKVQRSGYRDLCVRAPLTAARQGGYRKVIVGAARRQRFFLPEDFAILRSQVGEADADSRPGMVIEWPGTAELAG